MPNISSIPYRNRRCTLCIITQLASDVQEQDKQSFPAFEIVAAARVMFRTFLLYLQCFCPRQSGRASQTRLTRTERHGNVFIPLQELSDTKPRYIYLRKNVVLLPISNVPYVPLQKTGMIEIGGTTPFHQSIFVRSCSNSCQGRNLLIALPYLEWLPNLDLRRKR